MTPEEFLAAFDEWAAKLKVEAARLYDADVPHDQCVKIAITIVDAQQLGRARTRALLASGVNGVRRN